MRGASDREINNVWEKIEDGKDAVGIDVFVIGVVVYIEDTQSQ